ncbi:MAG: dephospho-CoA kinase [Sphingobacteriaceae bacterium]|nr:dephospho-CoA kinase [Cytophagaceae bacterium]
MSNSQLKVVGITGGIGSGKSLVCRIFRTLGVPVYEADARAKWLTTHDPVLQKDILELLGAEAYTPSGEYNRAYVAGRVFQNPNLLQKLNALIHPCVRLDGAEWVQQHASKAPYLLYEAALMRAAGDGNLFQKIVVVHAPPELRLRRVLSRDRHRSEADVRAIMASQLSDEERLAFADFILENNEQTPLLDAVLALHGRLSLRFEV